MGDRLTSPVREASVSYASSFSSQAQTPEGGPSHPADRPQLSVSQSLHTPNCTSQSTLPKAHYAAARSTSVFLMKGKNAPTGKRVHCLPPRLPNLPCFYWIHSTLSRTSFAGSSRRSPSHLSTFLPTGLFISEISVCLNPVDCPPPHFKRSLSSYSFQKVLEREVAAGRSCPRAFLCSIGSDDDQGYLHFFGKCH